MTSPRLITLVALWAVLLVARPAVAADELKPGDTLDQTTAARAEGQLPPEILKHYKDGGYKNEVVDWPESKYNWPPDLLAATKANEGKHTIGERGDIQSVETKKMPAYIMGHPFPTIDPADPTAGVKIIWNHFYRTWYFGNLKAESQVNWISPSGLERRTDQDVSFAYYDGVPEGERLPNPQNFLTQQLIFVKSPADLHSTAALTWRYRDPGKRDSSWSYVPALRRVRAVSPANRSDGFLGSDMSQDDGPFFDGKPEDFVWKLTGEVDQYRLVDKLNLEGKAKSRWVPEQNAWDTEWPDIPFIGYMDPKWKGVGWAPTGVAALAKRHFWVVEGVPRDRYYLYGKLEMMIDKVTYQGSWHRKFSWKGDQLAIMQAMAWNPISFTRPDGKVDYNQGSNQAYQCVENLKLNRATVAGIKSSPDAGFYGRLKFDPRVFDVDSLARAGK
jgi:hypothetical protein